MAKRTGKKSGKGSSSRAAASGKALAEKTRSIAAPAMKKIASGFGTAGRQAGERAGAFYSGKLVPGLMQTRAWLARRLHPASLIRDYRRLLLLIHRLGPDREVERLCFVKTAGRTPLAVVRVPHQIRRSGNDYRPTPRMVFEWAMDAVPEPVNRYQFVDFGAGRGRVLLLASHRPFERIDGVEIAEEFHEDCLLNIAQYPRSLMKCRDVDCQLMSATRYEMPQQEAIYYFNNPFNRSMLERVVGQIVRAYKEEPRRSYILSVDIAERELFTDTGVFEEVPLSLRLKAKIALFSPYSIALYRTVH